MSRLFRARWAAWLILTIGGVGPLLAAGDPPLRLFIQTAELSELRWPHFSAYSPQIEKLYDANAYRPVWFRDGKLTPQALRLIETLQNAKDKGLEPEDYDGPRWKNRLDQIRRFSDVQTARFDLALTVSVMRYVSDLNIGRVNPKLCEFGFDVEGKKLDLSAFLRDRILNAASVDDALASVEPSFPGYRRLLTALHTYIALSREENAGNFTVTRKPVEPGDRFADSARLIHLLRRIGDLPQDAVVEPEYGLYRGALVEAVKRFQRRHGLDPDGRIGKSTFEQLNTPLSYRVRQLEMTLERWRWVPHEFSNPPIVVNIPEFRLRAYDSSYQSELEMNVVVGRAYRHRTPVFISDMRYVIFRPFWNVPRSIERTEITPKIVQDRSYASKNHYEIVDARGDPVPLNDRTLRDLRSGKLSIRQLPGPANALGLVKFLFPNEHNVYMHDTPSVQLFSKARRDFSHGCIRLERPEELAIWVLRNNPEWTQQKIREAMKGDHTIQVNLKKAIPVLIVYGTAVAPQTGEVRFLADIYGHDASLEKLLAEGHN